MNENPVQPKVYAATAGGGTGGALGIVLIYVLERVPAIGDIPGPVEVSIVVLASAALAFVAGYVAPQNRR